MMNNERTRSKDPKSQMTREGTSSYSVVDTLYRKIPQPKYTYATLKSDRYVSS